MRALAAAPLLLLLATCATPPEEVIGSCGGRDGKPWASIRPPANAATYRQIVRADPDVVANLSYYKHENWFSLPSGEVMLCWSDGGPRKSCTGQWWRFAANADPPHVEEHQEWICVT